MNAAGPAVVAIVGRPNVGKSALFNRLLSRRVAIVEGTPGVTRDRVSAACEWRGRTFVLVDTGGWVAGRAEALPAEVRRQTERAVADARIVLFVVDAAAGPTPPDLEIAEILRRAGRPVLLVANKVDDRAAALGAYELHVLGLGRPLMVSATHGLGVGDLLDAIVGRLSEIEGDLGAPRPPADAHGGAGETGPSRPEPAAGGPEAGRGPVRVAVVGRPNVGKSSLVNALLGEDRVVVHEDPGTTRDAVDTALVYDGRPAVLIDTAGLRRRGRVREPVEFYSTRRTYGALARADVAVLVVDATAGVTDQDQRIARQAYEGGCAVVLAVSKWDLLGGYTVEDVSRVASQRLRFLGGVAVCPTSARTRSGIRALMAAAFAAADARASRIPTGPLNRFVAKAVEANAPATDAAGRRLHIYYATQAATRPPTIVLFVNEPQLLTDDYRRYLERRLRETFPLRGTPVRWTLRGRSAAPPEASRA